MDPYSPTNVRVSRRKRWIKEAPRAARQERTEQYGFWREHWPIVLVLLGACALRLHGLALRYLNFDESLILNPDGLRLGLMQYTTKVWIATNYNPGWLILSWLISRVAGVSTFWVRLPSAVCGSLAPVALYAVARGIGVGRRPAVLAGLALAFAIHQIEYSQQIMPHGALPLGCCLCIWLVTRLANVSGAHEPGRQLVTAAALVAVFGILIFSFNSTLALIPLLLGYWLWSALGTVETDAEVVPGRRRFALGLWVVCTLAFGFSSVGWFIAKAGVSDLPHLRPFFMSTFRAATNRQITSDTLNVLDDWYLAGQTAPNGPAPALSPLDAAYFTATRAFNIVHGQFKLRGEQQYTHYKVQWLLPVLMVFLVARGAFRSVLWRTQTAGARWIVCAGATFGLVLFLSAFRIFPFGGIRHLIVLSPLVFLAAAVGLESTDRRLARGLGCLCLIWVVGSAVWLPNYYKTTRDPLPALFGRMAERYGVLDFVAADTVCSEGALRLLASKYPGARMVPADDLRFARITVEHRPFFICTLGTRIFEPAQANEAPVRTKPLESESKTARQDGERAEAPVPAKPLRPFMHPLANLRHYPAVPVFESRRWIEWLGWRIYYMEPSPGPYPPEVAEITECKLPGRSVAQSFVVRFSKPMNPKSLNSDSVQMAAFAPPTGYDGAPTLALDLHYCAPTQTLIVTPLGPLGPTSHLLALSREVRDTDGLPLDTPAGAVYLQFPKTPETERPQSSRPLWD